MTFFKALGTNAESFSVRLLLHATVSIIALVGLIYLPYFFFNYVLKTSILSRESGSIHFYVFKTGIKQPIKYKTYI